jgi:predicted nucleic acid-binding protein
VIILDTNVTSEFMRDAPGADAVLWLDDQPPSSIWTTAINVYEIRSGLLAMPTGKKQALRMIGFERLLNEIIQGRIAAFDYAAAQKASELEAAGLRAGRLRDPRDTMIAGIVLASHATLATRNVKHFDDIAKSVVNPWN